MVTLWAYFLACQELDGKIDTTVPFEAVARSNVSFPVQRLETGTLANTVKAL